MKYSNTIEYNITTKLDSSGLTKMQNQIREIELSLQKMGNSQGGFFAGQVEQARKELQGLNKALTEAFNPSLGIIDISKFRAELVKGKVDSEGLASAFRLAGTDGQVAFNNLISQLGTFDAGMQRTSSAVDKMWTTFQNTFRWGLVSSFFSQFMNAIHSSVDYVKELDDSLTQIMLVTDYNRDSMNQFAKSANEAAKAVSMTTTGMTNASLIFAQQGYDLGQSQELATLSAKVANASQQDTATTSDQITAYMNAYGLENNIAELTQAMDNWALIANVSAADVGELAQASQRAASMANTVGVSGEQLAAQIATIESVTREAPEQIGNGLKTLYARFSDISQGGEDEDGVSLGDVTKQLNDIGVQILDQFGNIRDVGDIMEDLMVIWDDLDQTSKIAAAQSLAGKYQVNRFVSLMDNSDMYREYLGVTGNAATGTLNSMNEEYANSIAGRTAKMQATLEGIFSSIFNTDDIYPFVDAMQAFLDLVQKFIDAVGGAGPIITGVIAAIGQLFSKNLANAFVDQKINKDLAKIQAENYKNAPAAIAQLGLSNPNPDNQNTQALLNFAQKGAELSPIMSNKSIETYNTLLRENTQLANQAAEAENQFETAVEKANSVLGVQLNSQDLLHQDETGLNASPLLDILRNLENGKLDNDQASWTDAISSVEKYQIALANLHKEIEKYQNDPNSTIFDTEKINNVRAILEEAVLTGTMSEEKINSINLVLDSLNKTMEVSDTQTEEWTEEVKDASGEVEKLQANANNLNEVLMKLGNNGGIKDKTQLQGLADELERTQSRKIAAQGAAEGGQRQMSAFIKDTEKVDVSKNIISAVSALGQLASAIMTVQNLGSIWKNEDLSMGEKILQTVMNLSMIIPQVTIAANALTKAFTGSNIDLFSGLNQAKEKLQEAQNQFTQIQTENGSRNFGQELVDAQARLDQSITNSYNATKNLNQARQEAAQANDKWLQSEEKLTNAQEKLVTAQEDSSRSARSVAAQKGVLTKATKVEQQALDENFVAHGKLVTAQEEAALAAAEEAAASEAVAAAEAAEGIAAEADAKAQEELALAKKGVAIATGQLLATLLIPLAIGGIISVIDHFIEKEKEAKEAREAAMQAIADETTNTVQQINQTRDSFNNLWDQYKITGEASDQFKNALEQQCEILGITDGQLLIAQGNYDELKTKIDAATESVYANNAALLAANLENKDQNPASQLTKAQQEKIGITTHTETEVREGTGTDTGTSSVWSKEVYDQSAYKQVKAAQDYIEQGQEKINQLTKERIQAAKEGNDTEIQRIDRQLEVLAQDIATYQDFVNTNRDIISASDQIRDNQLDMELADPKSIFKTGNYDEIKKFIQDIGGETVDSSNIDELIAKYAELAGNANVAAEAAKKLKENVEDTSNDFLELPENNYRTDDKQKNVQEALKLSDEEYKGYQNVLVDDNEHLQALSQEAQYLEENKEVLQEHRQELEKETKTLQEEKDALEEKAEKLKNNESQYAKLQKEIKEHTKQIEKNRKELNKDAKSAENVQNQLEDLENKIIETAVGAKELGEVWNDNAAILRDSNSDWAQQADAINNLAPGLAHLLNMNLSDIQALPQSFWESTQNLNDMEAAINGDVEALQRLRGEVTQELLVKAGVDPTSDLYGEMVELIDLANQYLPQLEAGATLDDSPFLTKLNEMITTTIEAGGKIETVLAAYERLGLQFTEVDSTPMRIPHIEMQSLGSIDVGGATSLPGAVIAGAASIAKSIVGSVTWETVDVPKYEYKKTSGGAGFTGGYTPKSGKGGGGSCFVAGTLVSTSLGFRPIEQIQKGDIVLSYNKMFGLNEYSEVLQTMIHDTIEPIYTLYIKNEQLKVTGIHRFLVTDKITCGVPQWVHAADLKVGQWVLFADGTWHVIHKIEVNIEHQTVYNFEVSGNHNYYVGRNQILAHNKGGGKKGGSGGKAKTIEQKEKKNHEKDYYEEVDTQLEKVEKELSRIEKQQDKLTGDKARANQNKQLKLLQKQIELQKEHLRILTEEEKIDVTKHLKEQDKQAEKLIQKYSKLFVIPDPVYDEDGIISNYEQISKAIDDAHNKMIDEYNKAAKTGNEELTKQIQKDIDNLDKYGDAIRKDAQRINDITVEVEELNNTIQDLRDSMQDIRIDVFKQAVEARDGLKSIREIAAEVNAVFREFDPDSFINSFSIDETPYENLLETMGKLDNIYNVTAEDAGKFYDDLIKQKQAALDKATDADEKAAIEQSIEFFTARKNNLSEDNLMNGYIGVLQDDLATLQEWMNNPESPENIFGTDTAALQEMFQETYEKLGDAFNEYRELIQNYRDSILDIYDEAEKAIDRQMDKYDNLTDKIKRMSDTYALYYGEDSYAELDKFYAQQGEIMQNQLNQLKEAYAYWQQQYQEVLATGDKKLIQEIEDKMTDAEKAMLEKAEELADLWVEKFENIVEANTQSIYDKLFNGNNFNDLTDSWELQKDYMERYKDEVEKSYEIDKLRSKYIDLLNDSQGASLQTQNKIRQQMQEQLKQLQEQATVSEYDVKLANARLEILQKQIALEDAQRNKNQMQLRRDSQGNYRYTYRANQKDVKAAQDDLLDSEFNAYELTKNETISNNDRALNMVQDFLNKRADIFNKYKDDDEARTKALAQLSADYSQLLGGLEEDFKDTTNGMYDVLTFMVQNGTEDSATAAAEMLDNLFESEGVFKDDTEVLWASMADDVTGMLEKFENTVEEANNEMLAQVEDLRTKMTGSDGALTTIGSSADTMKSSLDAAAEATINLREETDALYDLFSADDGRLQNALDKIKEYEQQLQSTQNTTSSLAQSLKKANATLDAKTAEAQSYKTALDFATGAKQVKEGTKVKLKKGTFVHYDRYGGVQQDSEGQTGWRLPNDMWVKFDAPATEKNATYKYGFYATDKSLDEFGKKQEGDTQNGKQDTNKRHHQTWWFNEEELQRNVLAAMDTGGYTGDWEDNTSLYKNGKLALLHQKELVLNSSDTQNILSAVEIVRAIAAGINNQLTSMSQNRMSNFNSSISSLGREIQQRVEIKAEFPNVQDSYQIEQALLELSDQAYQYAHRNI